MANLSGIDNINASGYGYASAPALASSFVGNVSGPVVDQRVNEATGFEDVVVRVPRREQVRVLQAPPQYQDVAIPGPVVERLNKVVVPGPVREEKVVVPGPVVERLEQVPGPVRVVEKIEKVVQEVAVERIERVVIPGPEVVKEVKVEIPGPIVEKVVDVQIPGEEIIKRVEVKVPVEGPVVERVQRVDVPRDVVREVIQTRPVPRVRPVPVPQPGPIREVVVRVRDDHLVRENLRLLRKRDSLLRRRFGRHNDFEYEQLRTQEALLRAQLRSVERNPGAFFQPAATFEGMNTGYGAGYATVGAGYGSVGYGAAPVSYGAAPVSYGAGYGAAPVSYGAAPVSYGAPAGFDGYYGAGYDNGYATVGAGYGGASFQY